jgi:hypothetical protein
VPESYHAFSDPVHDKLLGLVLALGAETWVLRDRLALLEEALSAQGIPVTALIESLARRPERAPVVDRERRAFMERFLRLLTLEVKE